MAADGWWSRYTGESLALRVRTRALQDRSWPISCATSCSRPSDGQTLDIDEHEGEILAVRFTLRSGVSEVDRRADPSGQ